VPVRAGTWNCWSVLPSRSWAAAITRYGAEVCEALAGGAAAAGIAVVSGMARGLDAVAHHAALTAGGASIGVLGCGLGVVYPESNRRLYNLMAGDGLLPTEAPPGARPQKGSFPKRIRLIAGSRAPPSSSKRPWAGAR
jgi:DNA processing protein